MRPTFLPKISLLLLLIQLLSHRKVATAQQSAPVLTTKEVPLYIRQSWSDMQDSVRTACIVRTGVNPTLAFRSVLNTELANDARLKDYCKCVDVALNLMEHTTGEFNKQEILRQVEGVTPEIFDTCNEQVKDEVDLSTKAFNMYQCIVHAVSVPKSAE